MKVKILYSLTREEDIEVPYNNIKEILSYLKLLRGKEFTDMIINNNFCYMLKNSSSPEEAVQLKPEVIFSSFDGYDTLIMIPEITGHVTAAVVGGAILATTGVTVALTTATIIAGIINIVISIAISFLISLLSPTPEFGSDPSQAQLKQSSLFNGAPLLREQGGSVPIIVGNPFCGGVLISSGVSTEDIIPTT